MAMYLSEQHRLTLKMAPLENMPSGSQTLKGVPLLFYYRIRHWPCLSQLGNATLLSSGKEIAEH